MNDMNRISEIIREVFEDDKLDVTPDLEFRKIKNWDSFNHINLMIAVEDTFQIIIMPAEMENLTTVNDLINLMESKG